MAVISAGNRVIGREKDIMELVNKSPEAVWVLCNHVIYERIHFKHLFPYLVNGVEFAYRIVYLLSNISKHECLPALIDCDPALDAILNGL